MKKVILYVRVSTDEQAKLGYSLGHQELILTKFCEIKGWQVVAIYKEDYSAKNFERPEYKKLFRYCKANRKEVDYVLITKWDRYSRNQTDALQELKKMGELAIEVNAAEQWIDFSIPHNKMMLSIYLTIPEIDNDVRGINTKMGLRRSLKEGRWTGTAPMGFKNGKDHKEKPILLISEKAPLVREAFEMFATGLYDKEELRRTMFKKGLKLQKSQFPKFLENVLYAGKVFIPAYKDEDEEILLGIHEPIISEELFNKVQGLLKSKRLINRKHYQRLNECTPLRNLLSCPKCGRKLTSSSSKGRSKYYTYYHCHDICKERISTDTAHKALFNYFNEITPQPEIARLYLDVMESIFKAEETSTVQESKKLKENLLIAEKKLTALEEKYIIGEIEKDSYNFMKPKFKEEMANIKTRILDQTNAESNFSQYLKFGVNLVQNLSFYYEGASVENKQKLIGSIFPENLIIENEQCRTARENELIIALRGFSDSCKGVKKEKSSKMKTFPVVYPGPESNYLLYLIIKSNKTPLFKNLRHF